MWYNVSWIRICMEKGYREMDTFQAIMTIVSVVVMFVGPILAVKVGQDLQDKSEKRKDRMDILKALMNSRYTWTPESVSALNTIDIVFADDEAVRQCWKEYYEKLCIDKPNEVQAKQIKTAQYKLIEAVSNSLGYKDKVTWETIQNPYMPKGMYEDLLGQQQYKEGQLAAADLILRYRNQIQQMPQSPMNVSTQQPNDITESNSEEPTNGSNQ